MSIELKKDLEGKAATGAEHRQDSEERPAMGAELRKDRKRLLLHSCCGPCSTAVLERLSADYQVTLFYYNPNITDFEEYNRRKETQLQVIQAFQDQTGGQEPSVAFLEGSYEPERFYQVSAGLEREPEGGMRCEACFRLRLGKTAEMAAELGFDFFTTTLSVSPHKDAKLLNQIGKELDADRYLEADFKKKAGYQRSIQLSKAFGLYRQSYCGCCFAKAIMDRARMGESHAPEAKPLKTELPGGAFSERMLPPARLPEGEYRQPIAQSK